MLRNPKLSSSTGICLFSEKCWSGRLSSSCDCKCQSELGSKDSNMELLSHIQTFSRFYRKTHAGKNVKFIKLVQMKTWLTTAPKILCNWNMIWYQWHLSWSYFKILIKLALPSSTLIEHQISFHSFSQQSLRIRFTPKRFKITPR